MISSHGLTVARCRARRNHRWPPPTGPGSRRATVSGERLKEAGLEITNSEMTGATTRDRNLLTGDSPLAANQLGKDAVLALLEKFGS